MLQPGNPLCVLLDWKEPFICVCWIVKAAAAVCWSWLNLTQLSHSEVITAAAWLQTQQRMRRPRLSLCHFCCHNTHVTWFGRAAFHKRLQLYYVKGVISVLLWFCKYQVKEERELKWSWRGWWWSQAGTSQLAGVLVLLRILIPHQSLPWPLCLEPNQSTCDHILTLKAPATSQRSRKHAVTNLLFPSGRGEKALSGVSILCHPQGSAEHKGCSYRQAAFSFGLWLYSLL